MPISAKTIVIACWLALLTFSGCHFSGEPPHIPLPKEEPHIPLPREEPRIPLPKEEPRVPAGVHYPGSLVIGESVSDDVERISSEAIASSRQSGEYLDFEGEGLVKSYAKCRLCETIKATLKEDSILDPQLDLDCTSSIIEDRVIEKIGFAAWLQILDDVSQLETELKKVSPDRRLAYLRVDLACMR
ncbi:MAG: hypothetical protein QOH93_1901 [Chloroflexia bacterium]|jgi:hypothetical protein|nr:hypothetical protein [Chloroflexia bacterium]